MQSPVPSGEFDLVLETNESMTLADACNSLPPRPTVNKLLSVYFNTMHSQTRKRATMIMEHCFNLCSHPSHRKVPSGGRYLTLYAASSEH